MCSVLVDEETDMNAIASKYFLYDYENEIINTWVKNNYLKQLGNKVIIREEE